MAQKIIIYALQTTAGSSSAQPIAIDEAGYQKVMLYALSNAGGSTSVQPIILNADGQITRSS